MEWPNLALVALDPNSMIGVLLTLPCTHTAQHDATALGGRLHTHIAYPNVFKNIYASLLHYRAGAVHRSAH